MSEYVDYNNYHDGVKAALEDIKEYGLEWAVDETLGADPRNVYDRGYIETVVLEYERRYGR